MKIIELNKLIDFCKEQADLEMNKRTHPCSWSAAWRTFGDVAETLANEHDEEQ